MCVSVGVRAGLSVEERPAEEELEGALVHPKAEQPVLLHRGGPQRLPGQHSSGWELLCGGKQLEIIIFQSLNCEYWKELWLLIRMYSSSVFPESNLL